MQTNKELFDALKSLNHNKPKNKDCLNFLRGISDYQHGDCKTNFKSKVYREQFAEDILVNKDLDELECDLPGYPRSTFLMVFSPDGTKVASTHGNHNIYVTDIRSGKNIKKLIGHPRTPWCIAFHPSSNQIVASGCLGGHVRIWDLSGGSEVWTATSGSVIASIAFHPNERILVIATLNEVYFWDWSRPQPFLRCSTGNPKEKVRYVAFDKLGHKLITGIANSPQQRWERVRAPVPVPRQAESSANPYRRRITPRLLNLQNQESSNTESTNREPLSSIPERERRITMCYRNLVREYEQLVQRYLQLYRPPTMIDRGTDPMEPSTSSTTSGTQTACPCTSGSSAGEIAVDLSIKNKSGDEPSTSSSSAKPENNGPVVRASRGTSGARSIVYAKADSTDSIQKKPCTSQKSTVSAESPCVSTDTERNSQAQENSSEDSQAPSTSQHCTMSSLMTPSKILSVIKKPSVFIKGTQTVDSRKHKAVESPEEPKKEKRAKTGNTVDDGASPGTSGTQKSNSDTNRTGLFSPKSPTPSTSSSVTDTGTQTVHPGKILFIKKSCPPEDGTEATASTSSNNSSSDRAKVLILRKSGTKTTVGCLRAHTKLKRNMQNQAETSTEADEGTSSTHATEEQSNQAEALSSNPSVECAEGSTQTTDNQTSTDQNNDEDEILSIIRQSAEREVRSRILPIIRSVPAPDRSELIRLFENNRENVRMRFRNMCPPSFPKKPRRRIVDTTTSDSSSSDEGHSDTRPPSPQRSNLLPAAGSSQLGLAETFRPLTPYVYGDHTTSRAPATSTTTDNRTRNFNTELEQLVTSLLTEIERNDNAAGTGSSTRTQETQEDPPNRNWFRRSTAYTTRAVLDRLLAQRYDTSNSSNRSNTAATTESSSLLQTTVTRDIGFNNNSPSSLLSTLQREYATRQNETVTTTSSTSTNAQVETTTSSRPFYLSPTYTVYRSTSINIHPHYTTASTRRASSSESEREHRHWPIMTPSVSLRSRAFTDSTPNNSSSSSPESSSHSTSEISQAPVSATQPSSRVASSLTGTSNSTRTRLEGSGRRLSAFRPLRFRLPYGTLGRGTRLFSMFSSPRDTSFGLDELVNYSERENSEDDPAPPQSPTINEPVQETQTRTRSPANVDPSINTDEEQNSSLPFSVPRFHPFDPPPEFPSINPENIGIGNMYSNIVLDLESSLNDVRNIHASNRPGETSDMLSSFSERLENIMNQSDAILRNLRSTMDMLPSTSDINNQRNSDSSPTYSESNFFVRDQRTDVIPDTNDISRSNPVASDHTYPRNSDSQSTVMNNMSPLMAGLHLTILHIQSQARLLRQQVESIERIDRAMLEVAQLQLIRQLIVELVRHVQSVWGENPSTGVSSVRQMMAGTRISDNSPNDSPSEDNSQQNNQSNAQTNTAACSSNAQPSHSHYQPSTSGHTSGQSGSSSSAPPGRPRHHKTYPPSRLFRLQRQCRRTCVVHFLSRRQIRLDRSYRQGGLGRNTSRPLQDLSNPIRAPLSNYSLMTRRLEYLLTEQMSLFTCPRDPVYPQARANATSDLGEHIIVLRLHSCLLRMNRVLNNSVTANALRNFRSDSAAVSHDGISRYSARHTLSLIIDDMSHDIEEMSSANLSMQTRLQIQGVLAMSLLLSELLLLQIVDSIPPPTGMNLDPERESLTTRIDQMCAEILDSRFSGQSNQLTRSLRLMRLTMRHASDALGLTYNNRRNAMLPNRHDTDRRELFGSINRCLRTINSRRRFTGSSGEEAPSNDRNGNSQPPTTSNQQTSTTTDVGARDYFSTLADLIARYSNSTVESNSNNNSNSSEQQGSRTGAASNVSADSAIEDSDNDDDDTEPGGTSNSASNQRYTSNPLRESFINMMNYSSPDNNSATNNNNSTSNGNTRRPINVPSVQVNDVPVTEPSTMSTPRYLNHRSRFAERVSELRSSPSLSFYRPRFLHPFYSSINPFDGDLDDAQREQIYDGDMVATITPNHRIQAWDISNGTAPVISCATKNLVVGECKIHNDASVDVSNDGTILVTLLPSNDYVSVTNRLGVYSLRWETLGQCLYVTNFDQNAVSVSLSPTSRHLVVGLASRRAPIMPNERWIMARFFKIEEKDRSASKIPKDSIGPLPKEPGVPGLESVRVLPQTREGRAGNYRSLNCIRWLPVTGQGLIYATNTGQLIILT